MKLSDIKGEEAFDVLEALIDPASRIMADQEVTKTFNSGAPKLELAKLLLREHKKEIIEILAILDRVPVEEYEVNLLTLPKKLLEILNDPMMAEVFPSPEQTKTSSTSATENTEEEEI